MEHEGLLVAEEIEVNNYDIDAMGIVISSIYVGLKIYVQYLLMNI